MKAQFIHKNGGPEVFELEETPRPSPGPRQVLVQIAASSVNTADLMARALGPVVDFIPAPPAILGMDFAGTVIELGEGVSDYAVGDQVYGCAGGVASHPGALAEFLAADVRLIARKPERLSMSEAAALPLVAITAFEALFDRMGVKAGHKVLVHGGAGGVGHVAVQLARSAGAEVFATDSGEPRLATLTKLGATAIDYKTQTAEDYVARYTEGAGFDAVFDTVGNKNIPTSLSAVKLNGQVATTVALEPIDLTLAHLRGASLHVIYMLIPMIHGQGQARHGEILAEVARLVDAGQLMPIVDSVFPLAAAADAHRKLESKTAIGKVVVEVGS